MILRNSSSLLFFKREKDVIATPTVDASQQARKSQTLLISVVASASATNTEILWTAQTVFRHNSNCSCDGLSKRLQCVFPDNVIAKIVTMGQSTCAYYTSFDIAPYQKDLLLSKVKAAPFYVTTYNKSLNRNFQGKFRYSAQGAFEFFISN